MVAERNVRHFYATHASLNKVRHFEPVVFVLPDTE